MQEKRQPTLEPSALPPRWAISGLVAGRERQLVRARDLLREGPCLIAVLELLDEIQKLAGLIAVQT